MPIESDHINIEGLSPEDKNIRGHRACTPPFTVISEFDRVPVVDVLHGILGFKDNSILCRPGGPWASRSTNDLLYMVRDVPGIGKEHLNVSVKNKMLVIEGVAEKHVGDVDGVMTKKVSCRFELDDNVLKLDQIKVVIKNGLMKIYIPKKVEEVVKKKYRREIYLESEGESDHE
ncbi:hypothetical protein ACFE04_028497 [Oxalis oulophora]